MRPDLDSIREAARRIAPYAHRTPVLTSRTLNEMTGAELFFKCENLQKVGAFKFRGACNAIFSLTEEQARKGVVTHSSGNHAQALSLAARLRGIRAHIVMPKNAPAVKRAAVEGYGGEITFCEPTLEARERGAAKIIHATGAELVHSYNDARVISGQGTAGLELAEEIPGLDLILAPIGGGGLLSGISLAVKGLSPATGIIGVEPQGADDACRSFKAGRIIPSQNPKTIADGLLTSLGALTFPIIQANVLDIVTVSEAGIVTAMKRLWERLKMVIEPSGAVPLAAILEGKIEARSKRIGILLSGGNVDLDRLPW